MKDNLTGAAWRLVVFMVVCSLSIFALLAVFAQLRFEQANTYNAEFTNVTGLENGNFVRVAGVEVGKVKKIAIRRDGVAVVTFSADNSVNLTKGTRALVRYADLLGGRYLALEEGAGDLTQLKPGATLPLDRTAPALDLDALIGGFRPLFRALDPEQVNTLSGQLISVFQGQGATIGSFLAQTSAMTTMLADRDQLIGEVIINLNTVIGSLADQSDQFAQGVDSLSQLVDGLASHSEDISDAIAYGDAAAATITDLLASAREPWKKVVAETDRSAGIVVADHAFFDDFLNTLPDAYQALARQGLYGDYFSFYLCDLVLKLNGKGGQPVFVKVVGQSSGRCTPR